jgi:hypothetical protein
VANSLFKSKIVVISFSCLALLTTQACTTDQVLEGIGDVALVGAVAVGGYAAAGGFDDHHGGGGDFHGGGDHGGGGGGFRGGGNHGGGGNHVRAVEGNNLESVQTQTDDDTTPSLGSVLAGKFNLPEESAIRFLTVLQSAKAGQTADLVNLGINAQEAQLLAQGQMMSDQGLQVVATNLKQDVNDTRQMVQAIMDAAAQQKSTLCQAARESSKQENIPSICK